MFDYNWLNNTNIDNERRNYFLHFFHAIQQAFPYICMPIIINDIGKKEINISLTCIFKPIIGKFIRCELIVIFVRNEYQYLFTQQEETCLQ